ncbi:MAG: hypothetical protein ACKVIK_10345 [Rhodospirillales bacterium]|jgi:hypothetical protein
MKSFPLFIALLVLALVAGAAIFLSTWDIPAPVVEIEEIIPNSRFEK